MRISQFVHPSFDRSFCCLSWFRSQFRSQFVPKEVLTAAIISLCWHSKFALHCHNRVSASVASAGGACSTSPVPRNLPIHPTNLAIALKGATKTFPKNCDSYRNGLMTEFIGRMRMEKKGYQGVASISSSKCNNDTKPSGIQQKKSVMMMAEIFHCRALLDCCDPVGWTLFLDLYVL